MRRESVIVLALSVILHMMLSVPLARLWSRVASAAGWWPGALAARGAASDLSHGLRSLKAGRQLRAVLGAQVEQVVRAGRQRRVQRRRLQQPLQHAAGAAVLQALVRGQRVLGPVPPVTELAHVQRVRLLVLVLEVSFQGIVTRECPAAVRTLLWLVDTAGGGRGHTEGRYCWKTTNNPFTLSIFTQKRR